MRIPDVALLTAAVAIVGSDSLALSPIALSIAADFPGADVPAVILAASLYGMGTAASALLLAPLGDRVGLSRMLVASLSLLLLSLLASGLAPGLAAFQAAQTVCGVATGLALPAIYGLASDKAPPGQASAYLGRVLTGWTLSMVFGASAAAVVTDLAGWRTVYVTLSAVALVIVAACIWGGYLAAPLRRGRVTWPVAALRVPGIGAALLVCGAYMMSFYGPWAFIGTHLRADLGISTALAGLPPLLYGLGFGASAWLDPLIDRHGPRQVAPVVFSILFLCFLVMGFLADSAAGLIGLCLVWGAINHVALNLVIGRLSRLDPDRRAAILGLNSGMTYIAMFAGTALYGLAYRDWGFGAMTLISAAAIGLAAVEAFLRRTARPAPAG